MSKGTPKIHREFESFIEEYLPYIKYVCNKRKYFLGDQVEDMEQHIIEQILRVYHKKNTYSDFDWVVRTVIRRKAINFTSHFLKSKNRLVFENQFQKNGEISEENVLSVFSKKSEEEFKKNELSQKLRDFLEDIFQKINNPPFRKFFTDWEREYIEVVRELYSLGCELDKKDIMECMGYELNEKNKMNNKKNILQKKLEEFFKIKNFLGEIS